MQIRVSPPDQSFATTPSKPRLPDLKAGVSRPKIRRFTIKPDFSECEYNKITYVIDKQISEGSYGVTYLFRAKDDLNQKVLIKVEKPNAENKYTNATTMARESIFCILMLGDGAVSGSLTSKDEPHCVLEPFIEGPILAEYKFTSGQQLLDVFAQVVEEAINMHQRLYLTHGDIKANNIIVRLADGKIVYIDFTFMRFIDDPTEGLTASYLAPELKDEIPANPNQDVLSIGVMLKGFFDQHQHLLLPFVQQSISKMLVDMVDKDPAKRKPLQEHHRTLKDLQGKTRTIDYLVANQGSMADAKSAFDNRYISHFTSFADSQMFLDVFLRILNENRKHFLMRVGFDNLAAITKNSFDAKQKILNRLSAKDILNLMDFPAVRNYIRTNLTIEQLIPLTVGCFDEKNRMNFLLKLKLKFLESVATHLTSWGRIIRTLPSIHRMQFIAKADNQAVIKKHIKNTRDLALFLSDNFTESQRLDALNVLGGLHYVQSLITNSSSLANQLNCIFRVLPAKEIKNILTSLGDMVCKQLFHNSQHFEELLVNLGPEKEEIILNFYLNAEVQRSSFSLMLDQGVDQHKAHDDLYQKLLFSSYQIYRDKRDQHAEYKTEILGWNFGHSKEAKYAAINKLSANKTNLEVVKALSKDSALTKGDLGKVSNRLIPLLLKAKKIESSLRLLPEFSFHKKG